jgi:ribosomal protein S18 acetylase RimI-like enzyme
MKPAYQLVRASPAHLQPLRSLAIATFYDTYAALNKEEDMLHYLENAFNPQRLGGELQNPLCQYWLALGKDAPAGYLKLNFCGAQSDLQDPDLLELERIYVGSGHKGQGIGTQLIQKSVEVAKENSLQGLWLGVWEKNEAAIRFYERMGFIKTGFHHFVLGEDQQTDFVMKLYI